MRKTALLLILVLVGSLVSPLSTFVTAAKTYTIRVYNDGFSDGKVSVVLYDNNWQYIDTKDSYVSSGSDYTDITFYLNDGVYNFEVYYTPSGGLTEYWGSKSFSVCSGLLCDSKTDFHRNWPYEDGYGWKYLDSNHDSISTSVTIKVPSNAPADKFSVYYKIVAKNQDTGKTIIDQSPEYDISKGTTKEISDPYTKLSDAGTYTLTYYIYAKPSWGNSYILVDQVHTGGVIVPEVVNADIVSYYFDDGDLTYQDSGTATVQIRNTGNVRTTFSIALKYYKAGTSTKYTVSTKSVTLDPGQTSSTLSFSYAWEELYNHGGAGTYYMYFEVTKYGSSTVLAKGTEAAITVEAPKIDADIVYFDVTDSILTPTYPYNTGVAAVRVKNTGDIEEKLQLTLVASPKGSATFYKIDSTSIDLNPGETSSTLNFEYSYDELNGISGPGDYELYVVVYKDSIFSPLDTSIKKTVTLEKPRLAFEITDFRFDRNVYYVGDDIKATIKIKNTGNVKGAISSAGVMLYVTSSSPIGLCTPKSGIILNPGQETTLTCQGNTKELNLVTGTYTGEAFVVWEYNGNTEEDSKKIDGIKIKGFTQFELSPPFTVIGSYQNNSGIGFVNPNSTKVYYNSSSGFWHAYSKHGELLEGRGEGMGITAFTKLFVPEYTGDYYIKATYDYAIGYTLGVFSSEIATAMGQVFSGFTMEIIEKSSGKVIFNDTRYIFNYANPEYIKDPNAPVYSSIEWGTEIAHEWVDHWVEDVLKDKILEGKYGLDTTAAESAAANAEVVLSVLQTGYKLYESYKTTVSGADNRFGEVYSSKKPVHLDSGKEYILVFIPFEVDRSFAISALGGSAAGSYSELAIKLDQIDFIPHSIDDIQPPEINITSYPQGAVFSHTPFRITWKAIDDLTPSSDIEYSWKLSGYESLWSKWSLGTFVEYSLPPGHYLFHIRAKDNSGNVGYKSIPITVIPIYNATITSIYDENNDEIIHPPGENISVKIYNKGPDTGDIRVIIATTGGLQVHSPYEQVVRLNPRESRVLTFYVSPKPTAKGKESVLFAIYDNITGKKLDLKTFDLFVQSDNPPKITIVSPTNNTQFHLGDTINLVADISDDLSLSKIEVYRDSIEPSNRIASVNVSGTSYQYTATIDTSGWKAGVHRVYVVAYDNKNQKGLEYVVINLLPLTKRMDYGVFRGGTWIIHFSSDNSKHYLYWGKSGDIPVVGDFDGDGKLDYGVFRDGVWIIHFSSDDSKHYFSWGLPGDIPVVWGI